MSFKRLIQLSVFMLLVSVVNAQVGDIKKQSDKNSSNKNTNSGSKGNSAGSGSSGCSDDCFSACGAACTGFFIDLVIDGQSEYLSKKDDIPHMVSLDLMPHFGYVVSDESYIVMPRIRGNWAMFSTDLRYYSLIEKHSTWDFYKTLDWQVIQINPVILQNFILRLGTGFMYENYSQTFYNEHMLGFDLLFNKDQMMVNFEERWALDYNNNSTPRMETDIRFNYRVLETKSMDGYLMLGGQYQDYYSNVELWTTQLGFTFNIH